ncbi:hypothetical protein [Niabella soli]|uniref:Uncharacterized protein n=1 Tax=Niabella soli DSM 19437 TaxID=929713 RepID=W0F2S2_9BACT|nr:hypothetical protein [Niabella soli]AHF17317.1 hypothetical protein NIASO_05640 [Niabella soli DSM 19437]
MLFFKYFFYRIYRFYNKRWPDNDPELYGWYAVSLSVVYWFIAMSALASLMPSLKLLRPNSNIMGGKITGVVVVLGIAVFFYQQFLYKNRYLTFCNPEYFKPTIFNKKTIVELLFWLYILPPFIIIVIRMAT